ncbi:hypothetical protein [Streptomyces sp. NPDC050416]|uniref:hypothetical protein n=1 Tax=Streptomyces sp. NPDC050416 TaxID=3365611 RepID=UPI0037AF064E
MAAARKVSGAFTAPVLDADPDGDPPWLATQYVVGDSLDDRVRSGGPLPVADVIRLAGQLAEALRDIHRQGIVHAEPGLTLTVCTAEPGSPSEENVNLLATWAATQEPGSVTR